MNRDKKLIEQRREYIAKRIEAATCITKEIEIISQTLFISEMTIWRDIRSTNTTKTEIDKGNK